MNMKSKKIRSDIITFGIVIVFYAVMETMLVTDSMSSLMKGLLVPLCYYMILAASLNLVVGISGELSLGHAGFMCIGAFASAVFARMVGDSIPGGAELFISVLIGASFAAIFGFLIGIPVLRLRGDCHSYPCLRGDHKECYKCRLFWSGFQRLTCIAQGC